MFTFKSLLFAPGDRPERVAKAAAGPAELVVIDLEDSVAASSKELARDQALSFASTCSRPVAIRINQVASRAGIADLHALASADPPAWVLVPMVEHAAELAVVAAATGGKSRLIPLIETVRGLEAAQDIGMASKVTALMFGGGDFSAQLGVELAWEPLLVARSLLVMAAARAGVPAIDVPWVKLDDSTGLELECVRARELGFAAKAAIHPSHLEPINQAFSPSPRERDDARAALAAWRAGGGAAVRWNGQMVEAPLIPRLQRLAGEEHA